MAALIHFHSNNTPSFNQQNERMKISQEEEEFEKEFTSEIQVLQSAFCNPSPKMIQSLLQHLFTSNQLETYK